MAFIFGVYLGRGVVWLDSSLVNIPLKYRADSGSATLQFCGHDQEDGSERGLFRASHFDVIAFFLEKVIVIAFFSVPKSTVPGGFEGQKMTV